MAGATGVGVRCELACNQLPVMPRDGVRAYLTCCPFDKLWCLDLSSMESFAIDGTALNVEALIGDSESGDETLTVMQRWR